MPNSLEAIASKVRNSPALLSLLPNTVPWLPLEWSVAITTACNLKCKLCARTIYNLKSAYMKKEVFKRILEYTSGKTITIMGGGEPFMHPEVFDFIEMCQQANATCNIVTNGVLLTEDKIRQLLQYSNIKIITFSIDGWFDSYNTARVNSNFNKVIDNLELTSRLRKNRIPATAINFLGSQSNIEDFPKLIGMTRNYVDTITLLQLLIFSKDNTNLHLNRSYSLASKSITLAREVAHAYNIELILRPLIPTAKGCLSPWFSTYITTSGEVHPCCMLGSEGTCVTTEQYYKDAHITCDASKYILGNVMETDFRRIWNSNKVKLMRKQLKQVHKEEAHRKYTEQEFVDMLKAWTPNTFFCKVCMLRWGCAC